MRRLLVTALGLAALALPAGAHAQLPTGIIRPPHEGSLTDAELGRQLFAANCASCHGSNGQGVVSPPVPGVGDIKGQAPSLQGVGALAAHFYLTTGYMPLTHPEEQPRRTRVQFTSREVDALIQFVASLGPGPAVPDPRPEEGNVAEGLHLFTSHCAGCHQVVAEGGFVTGGVAPPLEDATTTQIAEAVRIGPYLMPVFSEKQISDDQLDSIIAYVEASKDPHDEGGWGLGHIGPVPEGMVTWFIGAVVLVGFCAVIGKRIKS